MAKKFNVIEKNAKGTPSKKIEDIKWEGEEISTESKIKISDDKGEGRAVILRFFEFGVNPAAFKIHKPTAQELFNTHINGMESLIWRDGLKFFHDVQPRFMFSKDKKFYRFIIACIPTVGTELKQKPQTLSQLLTTSP